MRTLAIAAAVAGLVCLASAPVRAQGDFPLKYTESQESDPLASMGRQIVQGQQEKPSAMNALPPNLSGDLRYFILPFGDAKILAVLDNAKPARLFVDAAGTGDLSGAAALPASGPSEETVFGPATLPTGAKVRFRVFGGGNIIMATAGGYMAGEVKLDGQSYRVALIDGNANGRYDDVVSLGGESSGSPSAGDVLAVDLNQDGQFDRNFRQSPETVPLMPMVQVKGTYYGIRPARDGTSIRLEKVQPQMGTIDVGAPDVVMMFFSDSGFHRLAASEGKWQVPAGRYRCIDITWFRKDAAGATWMITNTGNVGKTENLEVRPGATLAVKVGPPLVARIEAPAETAAGSEAGISLVLEGQAGETYAAGAQKDSQRLPAPKIKISDESGKVLAQGNFEFG
jgi:hypothetical protein